MSSLSTFSTQAPASKRTLRILFAITGLCWLVLAYLNIYYLSFASTDSWAYAAPGAMAKLPFHLADPFLGTFQNWNRGWGLHWPGGPMLLSIIAPFLPRDPATYVSIYLSFWVMMSIAVTALVHRLTGSPWLAFCAFLLVIGDRICFSVTFLERYELLDATLAIGALLALCGPQAQRPRLRSLTIALAFFLLPLLHPVFSGLAFGWLVYLGFRTVVLRQSWKNFCIAAVAYGAGWATFVGYYWTQPWLYAIFANHAQNNVVLTRTNYPPGIHTFLKSLFIIDTPVRVGSLVYLVAFGAAIALPFSFWNHRRQWREFLAREDMTIFLALGLVGVLFLSQFASNRYYWAGAWPFAVALTCQVAQRLMQKLPDTKALLVGALTVLVILHGAFWAGRTYLWYKAGFVNLRSGAQQFAAALPKGVRLFIPEVLWDTYAAGNPNVYMNSLPYEAGVPNQQKYAAFITPLIRKGDVLVIDLHQGHMTLINPHQPGWKEIAHRNVTYQGEVVRGFEMTAYQKQ